MLLLVDLDGVVYLGRTSVPGVPAALAARAARGDAVVYVTNNAYRHRSDYVARLAELGAPIALDRIVTSARATALLLAGSTPRPRRALVLGGAGLRRELEDVGIEAVDAGEVVERSRAAVDRAKCEGTPYPDNVELAGRPDVVVVGLDPLASYWKIGVAADAIRAGARFIATNRDPVYPTEHGLRPGAGSIVAAVETASGVSPLVVGKPSPQLLEIAAAAVGADVREAVMIGDGLATDMAAARAAGTRSVLMLTGVTTRAQAEALPAAERPTELAADAAELLAVLERLERAERPDPTPDPTPDTARDLPRDTTRG